MAQVLPGGFLFRYQLSMDRLDRGPDRDSTLPDLDHISPVPTLDSLSKTPGHGSAVPFATLRLGWHDTGMGVQLDVAGKQRPVRCQETTPDSSDGLTLWIDTRNTQTIHRASRFCHSMTFLPSGGGPGQDRPIIISRPIARAREDSPPAPEAAMRIESRLLSDGYRLQAWIGSDALHGWDTDTIDAVGFTYHVRDKELGDQLLATSDEFPYDRDPSLWSTLLLAGNN
jgi:hypothetical protein